MKCPLCNKEMKQVYLNVKKIITKLLESKNRE